MSGWKLEADTAPVLATFDDMLGQLDALPKTMATEFLAWQVEDVNRKKPVVNTPDDHTVSANFWNAPRSRFARFFGLRPVLRPKLYAQLVERMGKLLATISWSAAA
jgi:hypothetical protein